MPLFPTFRNNPPSPDDDYWYQKYPGAGTAARVKVSEETALKYIAVMACVSLISGDIARLPLNLYRKRADGGKDLVTDHKLYDLLHNAPNSETTSFNFRETLQGHLLLWGNSYSFIEKDGKGKIIALWQIPDPGGIKVQRIGGELKYIYKVNGKEVIRTRDQIFHIPGYGFNGLFGKSMISMAQEAIGLGLATEEFGSKYFGEGTHPSGILEMDTLLGKNRKEFLAALQKGYAGLGKSHKIMVLENGLKYKPITIPLEDSQFLDTRTFQKSEIAGFYHVPLHKIGVHGQNSNYNNLEQENASYVDSCLMHWIVRWESNISLQLLTEQERMSGLFFEFVVQGLLRGDSQARAEYYNKIFQVGGVTPNEIRSKENMNPIEGGDESFVMLNMIPLSQAKEMPEEPEPEPQPTVEEKKEAALEFFAESRAKKISEAKSIQIRDRIAKQYSPLILDAAQAVVNREASAIKNKTANPKRAGTSMTAFLDDFYNDFPKYIDKKLSPVLRSYLQAVIDATTEQLSVDEINLDKEIKSYIETYSYRHVESSKGQMNSLENPEDMNTRADEWQERRAGKIQMDEEVRASNYIFGAVLFSVGMSVTWRIRGKQTCPYCTSLDGKRINIGGSFAENGDKIKGGSEPMKIRGLKKHPPLHQGCDCILV